VEVEVQELEEVSPPASEGKYQPRNRVLRLYLFNDMLLVATNKSKKKIPDLKFKTHCALILAQLTGLPDEGGLSCFSGLPFLKKNIFKHPLIQKSRAPESCPTSAR